MGIRIFAVSAGAPDPAPPEPNPAKFTVRSCEAINGWTIATVHYPGCTTYKGLKLLVYACEPERVLGEKLLDPHFLQNKGVLSPVARFPPTAQGRALARALCRFQ